MLASFTVKRQFKKLRVLLHVDCERKEASATVTYEGRIVHQSEPPIWKVDTPDKAEKWIGRDDPSGQYWTRLEAMEAHYRRECADNA